MSTARDDFFDDGEVKTNYQFEEDQSPPIPATRKRLSSDIRTNEMNEDPTVTPRSPSPHSPIPKITSPPETINEEVRQSKHSSRRTSRTDSFEPDIDDDEELQQIEKQKQKENTINIGFKKTLSRSTVDVNIQTDHIPVHDKLIQTELNPIETLSKTTAVATTRKLHIKTESKRVHVPLVKTLFDQTILSALPIISFCHPFSMTSHINDIILAMPRHFMIINNQNSVSVFPWQQPHESTSTILECFWCPFLYKLLVTTLEDNRIFIYDFISIIDSIKVRGHPLSIKLQTNYSKQNNSSLVLPSSSSSYHQPSPAIWSQTRFTKSNSLGIYYCYISDRHYSSMLTRVDHNTRQHVKAIDCTGGSINNNARVCAMGLSEERVAIVLTNLIMTLYNAETLIGLKQINLSRWHNSNIRGVSTVIYLWKTWLIFDPVENKVVGLGKRRRHFVKALPERPINACSMDNGTLALWLGYPGGLLYYRLLE